MWKYLGLKYHDVCNVFSSGSAITIITTVIIVAIIIIYVCVCVHGEKEMGGRKENEVKS